MSSDLKLITDTLSSLKRLMAKDGVDLSRAKSICLSESASEVKNCNEKVTWGSLLEKVNSGKPNHGIDTSVMSESELGRSSPSALSPAPVQSTVDVLPISEPDSKSIHIIRESVSEPVSSIPEPNQPVSGSIDPSSDLASSSSEVDPSSVDLTHSTSEVVQSVQESVESIPDPVPSIPDPAASVSEPTSSFDPNPSNPAPSPPLVIQSTLEPSQSVHDTVSSKSEPIVSASEPPPSIPGVQSVVDSVSSPSEAQPTPEPMKLTSEPIQSACEPVQSTHELSTSISPVQPISNLIQTPELIQAVPTSIDDLSQPIPTIPDVQSISEPIPSIPDDVSVQSISHSIHSIPHPVQPLPEPVSPVSPVSPIPEPIQSIPEPSQPICSISHPCQEPPQSIPPSMHASLDPIQSAPNSVHSITNPIIAPQTLSIEQQMEAVLTQMEQESLTYNPPNAPFKPPTRIITETPITPSLNIHHLVFIYISHRGCTDRIRLLISYILTKYPLHRPIITSNTLSIPEFMQYIKDKQLPSIIVPILEVYNDGNPTPLLLIHDEPIFSFLLQTYHISTADPQTTIYEQNIIFTCQFIYHELWWFQHASEKESSDSQRLRMKRQFISNVLFPSLQIINREMSRIPCNPDSLTGADFSILSLLSTIEDQFSIVTDLFTTMKDYYQRIREMDFVLNCNRF